ncbi:adenosine deaminase/editase [Coniella lustricola]|uniref:Adenosine deaminase/editase n=1 Tax=Coniella lustricola TaxID=2025994 RepID=A0A2T3A8H1_9PEZI|nr:adenosine deaminase/editase [Coniella lustricola]
MTSEADIVASKVLDGFNRLPAKKKPQTRDNGTREWVPLAGIVAKHGDGSYKCLALATGMKCLPLSKLPLANGHVLHDWHAEVLAIRAFNHFILEQCRELAANPNTTSSYVRHMVQTNAEADQMSRLPFVWNEDVTLHMYCSEAPCGDASMELIMAAQQDAAPWEAPLSERMMAKNKGCVPNTTAIDSPIDGFTPDLLLLGRACFSHLGVVRRKPARPDAPPTLSKSCSDKLALKQCTSLLNSLSSLLVSPRGVYLTSLALPKSQFSETACTRCFTPGGRMAAVQDDMIAKWQGGYEFHPFEVHTTGLEFAFSRRRGAEDESDNIKYVASNLAIAWTANGLTENIVGGVLQGRKPTDPRGGSRLSRKALWQLASGIASCVGGPDLVPSGNAYKELKHGQGLAHRRVVKQDVTAQALKGWVRNIGDDGHVLHP